MWCPLVLCLGLLVLPFHIIVLRMAVLCLYRLCLYRNLICSIEPFRKAMTQAEPTRRQSLLINRALRVCADGGVRVRGERCYQWVEEVTLERHYWWALRIVVWEVDGESEDGIRIWS